MPLKVKVTYCGAWGYGAKFRKLEAELEKKFPGKLVISSEATPTVTGWFEVELENGKVLHSKKDGDGYVDTDAKLKKIMDGIQAALKWTEIYPLNKIWQTASKACSEAITTVNSVYEETWLNTDVVSSFGGVRNDCGSSSAWPLYCHFVRSRQEKVPDCFIL